MKMNSRGFFNMRICAFIFCIFVMLAVNSGCMNGDESGPQIKKTSETYSLSAKEKSDGWVLLFDGKTFNGWRGLGQEGIPEGHWIIVDGAIKKKASGDVKLQEDGQPLSGGDLMTSKTYENFELDLEWKISKAGNSGIKYNVSEEMSVANPPRYAALGFEYQILDDDGHPDAKNGDNRTAGALYDLIAPEGKIIKPVGEYNQTRIIFNQGHGEHWLNGVKVLEYDLNTPRMDAFLAASKYSKIQAFGEKRKGHIVLQDHTDEVWFRNIKIKELSLSRAEEKTK